MHVFTEMWLFVGLAMTILAVVFTLIGLAMVALQGRKGWNNDLTFSLLGMLIIGWLWPPLLLALPFVAVYRIVRNV